MYGLFCIVSSNLFFSDSMVLFLVLAHCFILCELATIYPMWFCFISSQGLLSIYTPWLPLWHVVTQHLEYSIRFNKEYYSIYQTTIYISGGTGLEYHPWGFGGVLNCSPGTYKISCSAINWSSCFLFVIYPPSCPSSSSSFFTNAILLLMSSRTLLWHLAPSMSKELFFWTLFKHVLSMFSTCFVTVSSEFSHIHRFRFRRWLLPCPSAPTLCVRTCEAAELVPVYGTSTPRGHGLWLQVDHVIVVSLWYVLFVNSGLVMHTKAISHWRQSCCLFLNMAVLGIYLWFQTIWQTKQWAWKYAMKGLHVLLERIYSSCQEF